jgi:hypothetical protein
MHYDFEFKWIDITWYISVFDFVEEESFNYDIIGGWFTDDEKPVPNDLFDYLTNTSDFDTWVLEWFLCINGRTI